MGVDAVDDTRQVGLFVEEIEFIDLHSKHLAWIVLIDEFIIELIEILQIFQLHLLLIVTSSFLNVLYQMWDGGPQVNHQVRNTHYRHHRFEKLHISLEITVVEVTPPVVVGCEDIHPLKDAPVLNDRFFRTSDV